MGIDYNVPGATQLRVVTSFICGGVSRLEHSCGEVLIFNELLLQSK